MPLDFFKFFLSIGGPRERIFGASCKNRGRNLINNLNLFLDV